MRSRTRRKAGNVSVTRMAPRRMAVMKGQTIMKAAYNTASASSPKKIIPASRHSRLSVFGAVETSVTGCFVPFAAASPKVQHLPEWPMCEGAAERTFTVGGTMTTILTQLSDAISSVIAEAAPSIVRIDGARRSSSTGIAWSPDLIIASAHAIRRDDGISIARDDGQSFAASVVGADGGTDIALLRATDAALRPIRWSDRDPRTGDLMIVAGRPGRSVRATIGIVSAAAGEWRAHGGSRIDRYIDVDAALPQGFSGGPLLDGDRGAIGMNTSRVTPGGTTIPHATLKRVIDEIQKHGTVRRPLIGIGVYPVEDGLLVMS